MAEKKKKQATAFMKQTNADFHKREDTEFPRGGKADFQPRDDNSSRKEEQTFKVEKSHNKSDFIENENSGNAGNRENNTTSAAKKISKSYAKKMYQETFGQNVQKSGAEIKHEKKKEVIEENKSDFAKDNTAFTQQDLSVKQSVTNNDRQKYSETFRQNVQKFQTNVKQEGEKKAKQEPAKEAKSDFVKDNSTFTQQDFSEQQEKTNPKTDFIEGYRHKDTYIPAPKKGRYKKKKVRKEYRNWKQRRRDKEQEKFSTDKTFTEDTKADFTDNTNKGFSDSADSAFTESKKLQKKRKQAEKAGKKVEKAREKLPKKKEYTLQRVFDEETGKGRYVVVPIEKEKTFKREGLPKSAIRRLQNEGKNYVHGKVAETEKENAAVEGSHKIEQKAEELFGFVKRQYRGKGQKQRAKVAKLEKKQFQKEVNFRYQKFLEENPQMQKKALQKRLQKQRIKREYMKAKKNGAAMKNAQEAVSKTANTATAIAKKLQEMAGRNAGVLITAGVIAVLLTMIMTSMSSCGAMFADTQSKVLAASYLSEPKEIDAADLQFTRLELDLQNRIDRIETDYPGYDEYSYDLGEIGHNPFTLINYLSAIHTEFTASEVEGEVQALFEEMYTLTVTPTTETRTRQVQAKDAEGNPLYDEAGNPVMEEEEYEVHILKVVLTVNPLETIVAGKMDAGQKEIYDTYGETGGLLQQFSSPLKLYWYNYISSYYGYRKNPNTGKEEIHRGLDIAVPTGTKVYAAHDGTVTTAAYDGYYGNYVVIEKDGYTTKYAHMESLNVHKGQKVTKGAVIGTTGNTGSSTGSHLHIECLYNGEYYNPLFYFDVGEGTLYGETPGGGGGVPGNAKPPESYDDATVQVLMEEAAKYLGYPYVWGGSNPSTSFDCSGFVCWVFTNSGVHNLPRTTAQGIYDQCTPVSQSEAKAGDIIFFTGTYNSAGAVSHVGIYCGNGVMIHCGNPISYASIHTPYWQSHFYAFGRLN
ncbi:MAG: peptidoglycan DD-metalloendopeptidase family protein [Lachnospiraceae bacterium]|nr:peptidoglycan DD-metalloendopeptidase family protein [Lachnospiraceae bacterium]